VRAGLGTDGAASKQHLDMFEAMRQASFLAKHARVIRGRPRGDRARDGYDRRREGARHGQGDRVPRSRQTADLILVRRTRPTTPLYVRSHLVYTTRGDDVDTTIVNGKILMRGRVVRTLDQAAVLAEARKASAAVRAAVTP
jgi:5-methylthioadenosine/S-adenosylhomocysteine deaminase